MVEAKKWLTKAAKQGQDEACGNLGQMYMFGSGGVKKDFEQAKEYLSRAAALGLSGAQCNLGKLYAGAMGTRPEYKKAKLWFEKAAEQGDEAAEANLGSMYYHGDGVEQNFPLVNLLRARLVLDCEHVFYSSSASAFDMCVAGHGG